MTPSFSARRPPPASLDRLMRNADGSTHRVKRRCFAVSKENPRPFDPARWFRPRAREPRQLRDILLCEPQLDNSTSSRHDPIRLVQQITEQEYKRCAAPMESSAYERFQGIDVLVARETSQCLAMTRASHLDHVFTEPERQIADSVNVVASHGRFALGHQAIMQFLVDR